MKRRRFTQDFKRSVVEQLLSETAGPAELCRRYNIASGQLTPGKNNMLTVSWIRNLPGKPIWKLKSGKLTLSALRMTIDRRNPPPG